MSKTLELSGDNFDQVKRCVDAELVDTLVGASPGQQLTDAIDRVWGQFEQVQA